MFGVFADCGVDAAFSLYGSAHPRHLAAYAPLVGDQPAIGAKNDTVLIDGHDILRYHHGSMRLHVRRYQKVQVHCRYITM